MSLDTANIDSSSHGCLEPSGLRLVAFWDIGVPGGGNYQVGVGLRVKTKRFRNVSARRSILELQFQVQGLGLQHSVSCDCSPKVYIELGLYESPM